MILQLKIFHCPKYYLRIGVFSKLLTTLYIYEHVCLCANAGPFLTSAFGPRFTADRGGSVTHFYFCTTLVGNIAV